MKLHQTVFKFHFINLRDITRNRIRGLLENPRSLRENNFHNLRSNLQDCMAFENNFFHEGL